LSRESHKIVGAETVSNVEGDMCGVVMRDADALPGSKTPSRANRQRRNLGDLWSGRAASRRGGPRREGEEP